MRWTDIVALGLCLAVNLTAAADSWPRFRGPNGTGISELKGIPSTWTEQDYEWVIDLPGKGHSSPVVWDKFLFVTTGTDEGARTLLCLDADSGKELWKVTQEFAANHLHKKNSYASGTPVVDGEHVVVAFADEQHYIVSCYSMLGELKWSKDLGTFNSQHGQGVSPIIYEGMVIVPNDQWGPSRVDAYDVKTGQLKWSSERKFVKTSYATPIVLSVEGKDQIVCLSGGVGLAGIDAKTGKELWSSGELPQRTVASPLVTSNGLVLGTCGQGGRGTLMVAVDPSGSGDVSTTHVKATREQNLPYVPTPIVFGDHLYLWNDDGIVCCVNTSGDMTENVWRARVGGNFSGSPIVIDGRIFCISEDGEVVVLATGDKYELLGRSPLGDNSYATPAVGNGRVYFRTFHKLACLKAKS